MSDLEDDYSDEKETGKKGKGGNKGKKGGSSCHQCKSRRNFTALTYCTSNLDQKKKCRKKFCGHCLKKFYKESPLLIPDKNNWKCPSCRKICCCAAVSILLLSLTLRTIDGRQLNKRFLFFPFVLMLALFSCQLSVVVPSTQSERCEEFR